MIKSDLADPTSDRVIEVLILAYERGGTVVPEILSDLADATTKDIWTLEEIRTDALEQKINSRIVFILPWLVLVAMTARAGPFREFYASPMGVLVAVIGGVMSLVGVVIASRLGAQPAEPRVFVSARGVGSDAYTSRAGCSREHRPGCGPRALRPIPPGSQPRLEDRSLPDPVRYDVPPRPDRRAARRGVRAHVSLACGSRWDECWRDPGRSDDSRAAAGGLVPGGARGGNRAGVSHGPASVNAPSLPGWHSSSGWCWVPLLSNASSSWFWAS